MKAAIQTRKSLSLAEQSSCDLIRWSILMDDTFDDFFACLKSPFG